MHVRNRRFRQIDVFGEDPYTGNPVAVVLDSDGLDTEDLRNFSLWSNLSECTFVLPPTNATADYRVRIFSLSAELPFAGHPTLGTARAWLDAGGTPRKAGVVIQECGIGLVPIRITGDILSFASPSRLRSGPVEAEYLAKVVDILGIEPTAVVDSEWLDNGPGWVGVLLDSDEAVRAVRPDASAHPGKWDIGVIGPVSTDTNTGHDTDILFELRAFFTEGDTPLREDPVTGSLNASAAEWMLASGRASTPYTARQGTVIGRRGRIHIASDDGELWIGGSTHVAISGTIDL